MALLSTRSTCYNIYTLNDKNMGLKIIFISFTSKACVVGTQKNRLMSRFF